jgi:hypothetical protein
MAKKKEFIMNKDDLAYEEPIDDCFTHGTALTQASTLMNTIISKNIF